MHLCGRAEPGWAVARPDPARAACGSACPAAQRPLLRRLADRCPHHYRRNRPTGGFVSAVATPPPKKVNRIGLELAPYKGLKTTLCAGCGHNAISERIIEAFFEMGVAPWRVIKLSGIGCSSKSPAYFLSMAHGFNAVHGRMPSVATGAMLANRNLLALGVSGDGDTASIGIGQFMHLLRRNLPLIYII